MTNKQAMIETIVCHFSDRDIVTADRIDDYMDEIQYSFYHMSDRERQEVRDTMTARYLGR